MENALTGIKAAIKSAALAAGFATVRLGYIQELASGQIDYDAVLILPPVETIGSPRSWNSTVFDIKYYLMRLNRGATGSNMTEDERVTAWDELRGLNKQLVEAITSDPSSIRLAGDNITVNPDSGGSDGLLPDEVVWIEVTFKIEVNACSS